MPYEARQFQKASDVIDQLIEGNERFLSGQSMHFSELSLSKMKEYSEKGQFPRAIILCCSDSRGPVEIIFDQDIGDLFVIRVAGNIVAPSLVGSVEFAAATFGVPLVVVMGHTQCGAIKATIDHIDDPQHVTSENIHEIVSRIRPHIFPIARDPKLSMDDKMDKCIELNVQASVAQLAHSSRLIENLVASHKLTIRGAVLDLSTGRVNFLEAM